MKGTRGEDDFLGGGDVSGYGGIIAPNHLDASGSLVGKVDLGYKGCDENIEVLTLAGRIVVCLSCRASGKVLAVYSDGLPHNAGVFST